MELDEFTDYEADAQYEQYVFDQACDRIREEFGESLPDDLQRAAAEELAAGGASYGGGPDDPCLSFEFEPGEALREARAHRRYLTLYFSKRRLTHRPVLGDTLLAICARPRERRTVRRSRRTGARAGPDDPPELGDIAREARRERRPPYDRDPTRARGADRRARGRARPRAAQARPR